ncbi:MAG: phosphatase PAP2 family protein [Anderseniella sp.]
MAYLKFLGLFCVTFFPVYILCGQLTAWSGRATVLHLDWERSIPLMPQMIWFYLSLYSVFLLPLFHFDETRLTRLSRQSTLTILVAGLVFLVLPARIGFPASEIDGQIAIVFKVLHSLDSPYNLVPSLHVAFAVLLLQACRETAGRLLAMVYMIWLALLAASTVLVHQHHILDVLGGVLLAVAVRRAVPLK